MLIETPKMVKIISNNLCYGPAPKPDDEVEQHLSIDNEGNVRFSGFKFGNTRGQRYEKARTKRFKIEKASAEKLLNALADYFENEYSGIFITDCGSWEMKLTDIKGTCFEFCGSFYVELKYKDADLSELVRDTLGMDDLFVFDGKCEVDL